MEEKEIELVDSSPKQFQLPQKYNRSFWGLMGLMLHKNYLLFKRQMCLTIFLLLSPLMICILIILIQYVVNMFFNFTTIDPPVKPILGQIPKCISDDCTSIGYFVLGSQEDWMERVMKRVAYTNNLEYDNDVKLLLQAKKPKQITDYLTQHQNKTQIAVVFCNDQWILYDTEQRDFGIPCHFDRIEKQIVFYTIMYNYTLLYKSPYLSDMKMAYPKDAYATSLKISLDNAILREFSGKEKEVDEEFMYFTQQEYPTIPNRFVEGIDIVGNYGAFYFFAPYLLNFLILINELLQEKGKKLRQGLTVMGLSHLAYWTSWIITSFILVLILSLGLMALGNIFQFDLFTKTPFLILFVLFITFGFAVVMVAFFIAAVCPDVKNGYTIAYGFILMALLMQMCFTQVGMSILFVILFYRTGASFWVKFTRFLLSLYPAFKYSLIYADIAIKSCRHYSLEESRWIDGTGFQYSDLWAANEGRVQLDTRVGYESPSALENYYKLLLSILFYIVLTYYFDHILESNRGKADSVFFFITKPLSYIRRKKQQIKVNIQDFQGDPRDSASIEKERVLRNYSAFIDGLRIIGLSKTYYKYPFSIPSKDDVHALKDVYLEMQSGELLALLGHNGAGKTTLINVLTGMHEPSHGSAQILSFDINHDMDEIRQILGVCPQFDILWNQLTAAEHLRMFAQIKGLPMDKIEQEVNQRLAEVQLTHVKDAQIQTFSGGMKRRVSLAISAIGDPRIIILDEPTTGMDPKARRQVWSMIKNMKQGRVVLLTTHAMEEADVLADRIAVMAQGELKAIGTSLFLKNNFSDGYRINIVSDDPECIAYLRSKVGDFKVLDSSGGSIIISIPFSEYQMLEKFFQIVEGGCSMIRDWGLSHATLEEVFMRVTKK